MNNYDYPLGSDTKSAPWNVESIYCPDCGSDQMEISDSGDYKSKTWYEYTCMQCGNVISEEPSYD